MAWQAGDSAPTTNKGIRWADLGESSFNNKIETVTKNNMQKFLQEQIQQI